VVTRGLGNRSKGSMEINWSVCTKQLYETEQRNLFQLL
jgi:hypothetical protein